MASFHQHLLFSIFMWWEGRKLEQLGKFNDVDQAGKAFLLMNWHVRGQKRRLSSSEPMEFLLWSIARWNVSFSHDLTYSRCSKKQRKKNYAFPWPPFLFLWSSPSVPSPSHSQDRHCIEIQSLLTDFINLPCDFFPPVFALGF